MWLKGVYKEMDSKIFVLNEERYKQVEVEVNQMDEDKTVIFLVPEKEALQYTSEIQDLLWGSHFSVPEIMAEMKESGKQLHYMCTMYDDRIEHEYSVEHPNKKLKSIDEKINGAKDTANDKKALKYGEKCKAFVK